MLRIYVVDAEGLSYEEGSSFIGAKDFSELREREAVEF